MTPDPAVLASGLSEAQRAMILDCHLSGGDWVIYYAGRKRTFEALVARGLARKRVGLADCLTPLGLAARAHLLASKD